MLVGEFAEKFAFVHLVFEGLAAVDEDDGDFVGELAAEFFVGVDVYFVPGESTATFEFQQGLFDDFAEVASLAGINHDLAELGHGRQCSRGGRGCQWHVRRLQDSGLRLSADGF
jgi:hypothetical protein